jgi:mannitol-specific phosphotransferase system IIBC component
VVVHLAGGLIEAHFHFFVMIPVVALYEAWLPFALGVAYVLVHHGVMGTLDPRSVYNHPAAWERPWVFAAVHAGFFASACIACVVNWWLHERARTTAQAQSRPPSWTRSTTASRSSMPTAGSCCATRLVSP